MPAPCARLARMVLELVFATGISELSSLAIVCVEIQGVSHEGVRESVSR